MGWIEWIEWSKWINLKKIVYDIRFRLIVTWNKFKIKRIKI
jgi:hypothetical protein